MKREDRNVLEERNKGESEGRGKGEGERGGREGEESSVHVSTLVRAE